MKFNEMKKEELESLMKGVKVGNGRKGNGRKEEVLNILKGGIYSVKELGNMVGVSSRNISSLVCYLRDDGFEIRSINRGGDIGLVLWSKIVDGVKVGNRLEVGEKGKVVRFDFEKGCFEDEVKVEKVEKVEEVEEVEVVGKKGKK